MKVEKETEKKIQQLQIFEQNLQGTLMQKQQFQTQMIEIDSALKELKETDEAYNLIGSIMVRSRKEDIEKSLNRKKEMLELRVKSFEKQEEIIRKKAKSIQDEIVSSMKEQ